MAVSMTMTSIINIITEIALKVENLDPPVPRLIQRKDKANNKGLIASSMMLSVVGMLNYMGNSGEAPICTQLNENFHD